MTPCMVRVGDLRGELVLEQVQRLEGERVEVRAGGRRADPPATGRAGSQPGSRGRRPGRPAEQLSEFPPDREECAYRAGGTLRWIACGKPLHQLGKSSGPPVPGSAQTSSTWKSRVSSWIRQGREVCSVVESLIFEETPAWFSPSTPPQRAPLYLVVRRHSSDLDDRALHATEEGERYDSGGRTAGRPAPRPRRSSGRRA